MDVDLAGPLRDIPVSSEYIIGTGDEIILSLWGRINAEHYLIVDRDGNIAIPNIGPLKVGGMRYDDMKRHL